MHDAKVVTNNEYWFRGDFFDRKDGSPTRHMNWFGGFDKNSGLDIALEVNVPERGADSRVSGFFAREPESGQIYLMHTGRLGGGTKGVGKTVFLAWAECKFHEVVDPSGVVVPAIIVMPISGPSASRSAVEYLRKVITFKAAVRAGDVLTPAVRAKASQLKDYFNEGFGRRKGQRCGELDYISRHGEIVEALKSWREQQGLPDGCAIKKSQLIDLGVASNGDTLVEVFEVKTSAGRANLYGAIGQLVVHGACEECKRYLVLPARETLPIDVSSALKMLGVGVLNFSLGEDTVNIQGSLG